MSKPANQRWDPETMLVAWLAGCVAIVSFLFYLRHGDLLLYGDAVAHINIARRIFDSRTPGLLQLGTVWLPLPHLLMIPFVFSDWMWKTGVCGSMPSLVAYVFGAVGIFRLVRGGLSSSSVPDAPARITAWVAALMYAANPNLIYLQSTAMTEPLYLALFIWAAVHFSEFVQATRNEPGAAQSSLLMCGWCLAGACLTRYDGWFLAAAIAAAAVLMVAAAGREGKPLLAATAKFVLLAAAAPVLWLSYNAAVYRNPLEFANGPYSAKAIERRTTPPGAPPHPGTDNLAVAASFFLKSGEVTMLESDWHRLWLLLALLGTAAVLVFERRLWPLFLLWTPLPFYTLSVAYGGVPIFIPPWWPHSLYNTRYGLELLPVLAVFAPLAVYFVAKLIASLRTRAILAGALVLFVVVSYASVWRAQPVTFREGWVNSRSRIAIERELANTLAELPHHSTLLMYLGDHPGAVEAAGIPLRRLIYEGNHRTWKQPSDSEGLWERALANPAQCADFVIASDGDPVSASAEAHQLAPLVVIHVSGQPRIVIYGTHSPHGW
jgi:hypothetical protein